MTECEVCHREPVQHGVTLLRVNEKGVAGIWRCREHITAEQLAEHHDSDELEILDIIETARKSK